MQAATGSVPLLQWIILLPSPEPARIPNNHYFGGVICLPLHQNHLSLLVSVARMPNFLLFTSSIACPMPNLILSPVSFSFPELEFSFLVLVHYPRCRIFLVYQFPLTARMLNFLSFYRQSLLLLRTYGSLRLPGCRILFLYPAPALFLF